MNKLVAKVTQRYLITMIATEPLAGELLHYVVRGLALAFAP
jgi:hypothetical protein